MSQNNEFSLDDLWEVSDDGLHQVSISYLNIIFEKKRKHKNL